MNYCFHCWACEKRLLIIDAAKTENKMADPTKALLKAATIGDSAAIRKELTAGVPINATDLNRKTPVMLAAQHGHVNAFHTLVERGADMTILAFNNDLLECAAEGGNVEIVQYLIKEGHPIEGRWKPRSKVAERAGHITPLIMAAINGRVDAVRVLLEAGANREAKFDGKTALKFVEEDIKYPNSPEEIERVPLLIEIAALLKGKPAGPASPDDSRALEVGKFAENARRPAHQQLQQTLVKRCGASRPWHPLQDHGIQATDVAAFTLKNCEVQKELAELQEKARKADSHLVLVEPWVPSEDAVVVLFPTDNKLAVVAAVGTEGANYQVRTADVIAWLKKLDESNPFHLTFCGHDFVGGVFLKAVKGAIKLAKEMIEICPSCQDEGFETAEELAKAIKKRKSFLLRWD